MQRKQVKNWAIFMGILFFVGLPNLVNALDSMQQIEAEIAIAKNESLAQVGNRIVRLRSRISRAQGAQADALRSALSQLEQIAEYKEKEQEKKALDSMPAQVRAQEANKRQAAYAYLQKAQAADLDEVMRMMEIKGAELDQMASGSLDYFVIKQLFEDLQKIAAQKKVAQLRADVLKQVNSEVALAEKGQVPLEELGVIIENYELFLADRALDESVRAVYRNGIARLKEIRAEKWAQER